MDPVSIIVMALVTGAAALKPTTDQVIRDAYAGMKGLIQNKYEHVEVAVLETDPKSKARQAVVKEDLEKADAGQDEELLRKAKALLEAVRTHASDVPKTVGLNLEDISGASLTAEHILAEGSHATGVKIKGADIQGDITFRDVTVRSRDDIPPKMATEKSQTPTAVHFTGSAGGSIGIEVHQSVYYVQPIARDFPLAAPTTFSKLIEEATRDFVGRRAVFDALENFLHSENGRGYFCIIAAAGLGKTALAAEIARRYQAPAFFADARRGLTRPGQCHDHLSEALRERFDLTTSYRSFESGKDSASFSTLLTEAAQQLRDNRKGPLVIVVDALDEAENAPPGGNVLLLPPSLPEGVFIVVTQRPGHFPLSTDLPTQLLPYRITQNDQEQKDDIKEHLRH